MEVTRYVTSELETVVELFRQNVPAYFHTSEEIHLRNYLRSSPQTYFLLWDEVPVGCGGFTIDRRKGIARISWDFVGAKFHRKGYGSILLKHRIDKIREVFGVFRIEVLTSQMAFGYYQNHGFYVVYSEKDHWAKGYDLVAMRKDL